MSLSIFLISLLSFILGGLWFSPLLFGKIWQKNMEKSQKVTYDKKPNIALMLLLSISLSLIKTCCAFYVLKLVGNSAEYWVMAIIFILLLLGVNLQNLYFAKRDPKVILIESSYQTLDILMIFLLLTLAF